MVPLTSRVLSFGAVGALVIAMAACGDDSTTTSASGGAGGASTSSSAGGAGQGGGGNTTSVGGSGSGGSGGAGFGGFNPTGGGGRAPCSNELVGTVRDFKIEHPDFEGFIGVDPGIVLPDLGVDLKPVYAGMAGNPSTSGQANFDQWFRDVAGVNLSSPLSIALTEMTPGVYTYQNAAFFPIDGLGFGDEGNIHNYHFTFEIHAAFEYVGGEVFTFDGDDDVFVFINGKLAIDLGGVHGPLSATIDLDAEAAILGITTGTTYPLDFFFAERHTTQSNFRIDTGIACFTEVQPPQ